MNVTIKDISYSDTGGSYSALNSKLYIMDEFDLQSNDGSASESTTYGSKSESVLEPPQLDVLQEQLTEQQSEQLSNPVQSSNNAAIDGEEFSGHSSAGVEEGNPTNSMVNAATSTAALVGVNEEAVRAASFDPAEIAAGSDSSGGGGSGSAVNDAIPNAAANTTSSATSVENNVSNTIENSINNLGDTINSIENLIDVSEVTNIVNNTEDLANNVVNNITDITENVVNNVSNITSNVVHEITDITENVVNNATEVVDNVVNNLDEVVNNILDVSHVNDITSSVINNVDNLIQTIDINSLNQTLNNVFNTTSNLLLENFDNISNTANSVVNYTSELLGDAIGPIQFSLNVDMGLDSHLVNQLDLSNLSGSFSSLNENLTGNAVFDVTSDYLNLNIDAGELLSENPVVSGLEDGLTQVLGEVDQIGDQLPVLETVDNVTDSLLPNLPIDQMNLGLSDEGSIEPTDALNLSNNTNITEDLGTFLNSDSNTIDNSLDLLNNDGDSEITDLLSVNDSTVVDSANGLDQFGSIDNTLNTIQGDAGSDLETVMDTLGTNADTPLDIGGDLNEIINQMQTGLEDNVVGSDPTPPELSTSLPTIQSDTGGDAIYDAIASTMDSPNSSSVDLINDVDMGGQATAPVVDVVEQVDLLNHHLGL